MKIMLANVRLAFPALFEAKAVNGEGEPRFSGSFIIDPKAKFISDLEAAIEAVAKEKWGAKAAATLVELYKKDRVCFKKEEKKSASGDVYAGFEESFHLNAGNKSRPTVLDRDKTPLTASDGRPYAGCYVNANIEIWAQDNSFGKRINATLRGVQFVKDGEAFSGGTPASADEFDDLGVDTEAESLV